MAEPIFFKRSAGLTVGDIEKLTGARLREGADRSLRVSDVAPLDRAGPQDLTFFESPKHAGAAAATQADACLTTERLAVHVPESLAVLYCSDPYRAFVAVARALFPDSARPSSLFEPAGIAAGAHVHPSARLESGVTIDPGVVIGPRAEIGAGTVIAAGATIGADVRIGRHCSIGPGATIGHALIGDRVIVHAGARIGQDGYGYLRGPKGHEKIPQIGRVILQDDTEIGTNTSIDRGSFRDTVIGEGSKIDNLVQIGHNCLIGRHCLLAGQVGISGSVTLGDYVMLGGKAGIADHVTVGEGAVLAAGSALMSNVPAGEKWGGHPASPARDWLRGIATLRSLARRQPSARPGSGMERGEE
jgi:UDP-3-O-[3-hydroxymyristoyl] glucosamine N-acyltransferase